MLGRAKGVEADVTSHLAGTLGSTGTTGTMGTGSCLVGTAPGACKHDICNGRYLSITFMEVRD
jgi:hypothetical protein